MATNVAGVYAAGDITDYPGKVRLISVGFGEAALGGQQRGRGRSTRRRSCSPATPPHADPPGRLKDDPMPYVIAGPASTCMDRSCIEECPVDCIYEGDRKLYINPRECIDCGACEPVCPVEAITQDRRVARTTIDFVADNKQFFHATLPGRDEPLGHPAARTRSAGSE